MNNVLSPMACLQDWLAAEQAAGAVNPQQAVLSTVATLPTPIPHARVVAVREVDENGLLFFTQQGTRKVSELRANPNAVMTFWFELHQRQVSLEGEAYPLSSEENARYWQANAREAQIRFCSYAPTSGQPISSKDALEQKRQQIRVEFEGKAIPPSPLYRGFRFKPVTALFYSYRTDEFSDVSRLTWRNGSWIQQRFSP